MSLILAVLLFSMQLTTCRTASLPTSANYAAIKYMEEVARVLPWPSFSPGHRFRALTDAQLVALGKQYYPNIPKSQNATAMVLVIYDWSMPDYRRPQFYLTARGNITTMGEMITFIDPMVKFPNVPAIFGLLQGSKQYVMSQLISQQKRVEDWCEGEANVLRYALVNLPPVLYSAAGSPRVLYRGDARGATYFCNQFTDTWGLSVDTCIAQYFQPNSTIEVRPFWSTTPDATVITHFTGRVRYTIFPNPTRTAWAAPLINDFSSALFQDEYTYPADSQFAVLSTACQMAANGNVWSIQLMELDPLSTHRNWLFGAQPSSTNTSAPIVTPCVD